MFKKGFSAHIDWVIGIGIFLVYLGLVFIIFKPGVTPVFDSETLLDIVETNFIDYNESNGGAWWNISKTPIFVTATQYGMGVPCSAKSPIKNQPALVEFRDFSSKLSAKNGFNLGLDTKNKVFFIPEKTDFVDDRFQEDENNLDPNRRGGVERNREDNEGGNGDHSEEIPAHTRVDADNPREETSVLDLRPFSVGFSTVGTLSFFVPFKNEEKMSQFLLLHSENGEINELGGLPPADQRNNIDIPGISFADGFKEGCYFENVDPLDANYFPCGTSYQSCIAKYDFGTTEYVEGINVGSILDKSKYNEIKSAWKFPELKEFQIVIYDNKLEYGRFPDLKLPAGVNVYSRQVNTFILNKDGIRIPVTVNFMVW